MYNLDNNNDDYFDSLQLRTRVLLEQHRRPGVGVDGDLVERVELAGAIEHILVHLAVVAAERAVEDPVVKGPRVDEADGVRPDLLEQDLLGVCAGEDSLAVGSGAGGGELGGLLDEGVEGEEPEKVLQDGEGVGGQGRALLLLGEDLVEVLDDHVLGVRLGSAVEVGEHVVPARLELVTLLLHLKGEVGGAPGEGSDDVGVRGEDVEGGTSLGAGEVLSQDGGGLVLSRLAGTDGAGRLEELLWISDGQRGVDMIQRT